MPAVAVGEACAPIIGYSYGARRADRVISAVKNGMIITTFFYLLSFLSIMFYAEDMASLFNSEDGELITLAARCMRYANFGIPVMSVSIICTSLLQGLGRGRDGLILAALRFGIFLWIPLLILPRRFGVAGIWGSFPVSDFGGTIVSAIVMARTVKRLRGG
jgi:Na+-driven multidrug efflux pump